jgi:chromatin remodeling complex protein RSC6
MSVATNKSKKQTINPKEKEEVEDSTVTETQSIENDQSESVEDVEEDVFKEFDDICSEIANMKNSMGSLTTKLKQYKKKIDKILKDKAKASKVKPEKGDKPEKEKKEKEKKEKKSKEIVPPSGINKPCTISDTLCEFLDKPSGSQMIRTDVTQALYAYIKEHKLQDPGSKLTINQNDKLCKLLDIDSSHKLTYQNLQTHMNKHYLHTDDEMETKE